MTSHEVLIQDRFDALLRCKTSTDRWEIQHQIKELDQELHARCMAIAAHGGQKYGNEPYVVHLDEVADLAKNYDPGIEIESPNELTIIGFLHDTLEDTKLDKRSIEDFFGKSVRFAVEALTDCPGANRKERKAATYKKLAALDVNVSNETFDNALAALDDDLVPLPHDWARKALIVKAADRLANVRRCAKDNPGLLRMYREEHPTFRKAVRRDCLNTKLIAEIDQLLGFSVDAWKEVLGVDTSL